MADKQLNVEQIKALSLIMEGKSDQVIASILGVDRGTIWRWKNKDILFESELNRLKNEVVGSINIGSQTLLKKSIEIIQEELTSGENRVNVALSIIKTLKLPSDYLTENYDDLKREKEHKEKVDAILYF